MWHHFKTRGNKNVSFDQVQLVRRGFSVKCSRWFHYHSFAIIQKKIRIPGVWETSLAVDRLHGHNALINSESHFTSREMVLFFIYQKYHFDTLLSNTNTSFKTRTLKDLMNEIPILPTLLRSPSPSQPAQTTSYYDDCIPQTNGKSHGHLNNQVPRQLILRVYSPHHWFCTHAWDSKIPEGKNN